MKRNWLGTLAAAAASLMMLLPPRATASEAAFNTDVALGRGGLLVGQVVDPQGLPKAGAVVAILHGEHEVARTTTDADGVFAAQGLRGGQYVVLTEDGGGAYRLWAADTAPPAARPAALVVSGNQVVRGAPGHGPMGAWVNWMKAHPYLVAGTVAAAIAVPLAFADDWWDKDNGS